jgi:peptidoglycan-associated lipoprotein
MKLNKIGNRLALGVLLTIAAAGCKHTQPGVTNVNRGHRPDGGVKSETGLAMKTDNLPSSSDNPADFGHALNSRDAHKGWIEDATVFKAYTAHFEFDSSNVRAADKANLEAVAAQLKSNPTWAVRVEGNCDERGTEEYNRSLGERRALVLRESLIALGIEPSRIDNISYGEDKPVATGHDEAAWSQNRRGDFVQLTPPKPTFLSEASAQSNP